MRVTGSVVFALIAMLCSRVAAASAVAPSGGQEGTEPERTVRTLVLGPGRESRSKDGQQRPEPAAVALLGIGFAVSVALHRRRRGGRVGVAWPNDPATRRLR